MPYSTEQKNAALQSLGFDPSQFDLDETTYQVTPKRSIQPSSTETPKVLTVPPDKHSAFGTAALSFAEEAPSSLTSGIGAGAGMALGASLLPTGVGTIPGAAIMLGSGLLGGYAGKVLGRKAQDLIEPESWQKNVQEAQQEHPIAGTIGGIATLPLSGFNASPSNVGKALGGVGQMVMGHSLKADELANLVNVGMGTGLGVAQPVAESLIAGNGMPSAKDVILSGALGAFFNKPNVLGKSKLMGFHDNVVQSEPNQQTLKSDRVPLQQQIQTMPEVNPAEVFTGARQELQSGALKSVAERSDKMAKYVSQDKYQPKEIELQRFEDEGGPVRDFVSSTPQEDKIADFHLARIEQAKQERASALEQAAKLEEAKAAHAKQQLQMSLGVQAQPNEIMARGISTMPEQRQALGYKVAGEGMEYMPEIESGKLPTVSAEESAADLFERRLEGNTEDKYSEGSNLLTSQQKDAGKILQETKAPFEQTPAWLDFFKKLGLLRNYEVNVDNTIKNTQTGKPINGVTVMKEGLKGMISVRDKNGADVLPHEALHAFVQSLKNSPRARDKQFYTKYEQLISELPEYKDWAKARLAEKMQANPEEFAATNGGIEAWKRAMNTRNETGFQKWKNDFGAYIKTRFGKHADAEDYQRLLTYKLYHDPSFEKLFGKEGSFDASSVNTTDAKNQEAQQLDLLNVPKVRDASAFAKMRSAAEGNEDVVRKAREEDLKNVEAEYASKYSESPSIQKEIAEGGIPPHNSSVATTINSILGNFDKQPSQALRDLKSRMLYSLNTEKTPSLRNAIENIVPTEKDSWKNFIETEYPAIIAKHKNELGDAAKIKYVEAKRKNEAVIEESKTPEPVKEVAKEPKARDTTKTLNPKELTQRSHELFGKYEPIDESKLTLDELAPENKEQRATQSQEEWKQIDEIKGQREIEQNIKRIEASYKRLQERIEQSGINESERYRAQNKQAALATQLSYITSKYNMPYDGPIKVGDRYSEGGDIRKQTETPEFKRWFGESKVVDSEGNPKVVYHGTANPEFNSFEIERGNHGYNLFGKGVYLAGSPELASTYAKERGEVKGGVMPLHVKLENPFNADAIPQGELFPFIEKLNKTLGADYTSSELRGTTYYFLTKTRNAAPLKFVQRWEGQEKVWALEGVNGVRLKNAFGKDFTDALQEMGYDGIQYKSNWRTGFNVGKDKNVYVVFKPEQIKSSIANKGTYDINNPDIRYSEGASLLDFHIPEIDKIRKVEHPDADKVADSLVRFYQSWRGYKGKLTNDIVSRLLKFVPWTNPKQAFMQDIPEFKRVMNYRWDMEEKGASNITLTAKEKEINDIVTDNLQKSLDEKNALPNLRHTPVANPNYLPNIPARKVLDTLLNHPVSPEAKKLVAEWDSYYKNDLGKTQKEADDAFEIFKKGYEKQSSDLASQFGPIDKASGLGIPRSWRETSLVDLMSRFNNRYGRRLAFHKEVESNPDVMKALSDSKTGMGAADVVKNVMSDVMGVRDIEESKRNAISGIIRAGMLGPLTGVKDVVAGQTLGLQHQDLGQILPAKIEGWIKIAENIKDSLKAGINRENIAHLEFGNSAGDDVTNVIARARDVINVVQGRNFLEKVARATAFGEGKFLAMDNLLKAKNGRISTQGRDFLDNFCPEDWRTYRTKGQFPTEILNETAARYVESVQGTYDYRGLPSIAQKGSLSWTLSLARWNIEKLNNFEKYVVRPAKKGNFKPLLMATIGMVAGGEAVNQIVELITGRKEKTPKYAEIAALSEEGENTLLPITYKLAGLASLSGYAGIIGDLAKSTLDYAFKNKPQVYDNPLISGISSASQNVGDLYEALRNGDLDITGEFLSQFLEDSFQAYRLGLRATSEEKNKTLDKQNKFRDLKLWKTTHGKDVGNVTSDRANPFKDKDIKEFKKTDDLQEASALLPELVSKAMEKADGDIEVLRRELAKIKQNNYQTMPSPESMPKSFLGYLNYLRKTQGEEAANQRLTDYLLQNKKNKVKSSLVPNL
jgi:hypothetical protein